MRFSYVKDINDTSGKILDPLKGGIRIYCIVGFCDIHRFDEVNQRMKIDVLQFVNTIAAIVHGKFLMIYI